MSSQARAKTRERLTDVRLSSATLMEIGSAVSIPPLDFILDRPGVSAARPWLWMAVFVPRVVADVLSVVGGSRCHSRRDCPTQLRVSPERIGTYPRARADRMGY